MFFENMSHQQLLLETTERFKTLIALTVEQCNAILDTYLQQVQAIQVGVSAAAAQQQQKIIKPKSVVAVAAAAEAAAEASLANSPFSEHWPSSDGGFGGIEFHQPAASVAPSMLDLNEEDENGQVDDSFIDYDQEDMIFDDDDEDEEVASVVEDEEDDEEDQVEDEEDDSSSSMHVSNASKKRVVPLPPPPAAGAGGARPQRNRKRTRLFSFDDFPNQDKDEVANDIDLFDKESDGSAGGGDIILDDFRYFLRRVAAKGPRTTLVTIMDATPFSRNRFVAPLNQIRQGLGHDGPRSRNARRLFDSILNKADDTVSVLQTGYKGGEKQTCALCCTKRNCTAELYVDDDTHYVANKCIRIAEALIPFSKMVYKLSKQDAETVTKKDLFELDKQFGRIMAAHANKMEEI